MIRHVFEKTHVTNNLKLEYVREWKKTQMELNEN